MERHETKARDIRVQLEALAGFVTPEALAALSVAAETDESWSQAAGDVSRYLEERNIKKPPPGSEISLFRASPRLSGCASAAQLPRRHAGSLRTRAATDALSRLARDQGARTQPQDAGVQDRDLPRGG